MSKVLVIDDCDTWYEAIESQLAKQGYTALRARHHDEAVATALDEQPTLVIIDVLLAARGGAGFVRRLRSVPGLRNAPMVLTSSGTGHSAVRQALGPHAEEIVPKNAIGLNSISERLQKLPVTA